MKLFFPVHSNFTYDFEAYDVMKLCFKNLLEILVSPQFKLYTHYSSLLPISPNFLQSNRLINFREVFHYCLRSELPSS